jgi:hypothetical protein
MTLPRLDPFGALAGAAALSMKDALRFARHSLRAGRRRMAPIPDGAPLAGVARGLIEGAERTAEGSLDLAARAAKAALAGAPFAPRPMTLPAPLDRLEAAAASPAGAVAAADALYEAMTALLRRMGADGALVLEQPLRAALVEAMRAGAGGPPAARAARLARALDAAGAALGAPADKARLGGFALGLALAAASAGGVKPGQERAALDAAADLSQAIEAEALAAMASGEGLDALIAAYAPHL